MTLNEARENVWRAVEQVLADAVPAVGSDDLQTPLGRLLLDDAAHFPVHHAGPAEFNRLVQGKTFRKSSLLGA